VKLKTFSGKSQVVVRASEKVYEVVRESEKVGNRCHTVEKMQTLTFGVI